MTVADYLLEHQARAEAQLMEFLRIPSVSTDPAHSGDVERCAQWLAQHLRSIGMPHVEIFPTKGHPIVYAEYVEAGPNAPTVLFYGHYDVQPVDPIDLWTNPPFEPTVRDGKVYARGATDDKGQVFLHIKALEAMLAVNGKLPVNVKLLIEGEEEIGSPNLAPFVKEKKKMLKCNAVLVSDTPMFAPGMPSLVYGLRGLAYLQIDVQGPNRDLHSGSYGGAVANPLNALAQIIAQLKSPDGTILVPGFFDDVLEISHDEHISLMDLDYDEDRLLADVGATRLVGEKDYTTPEQLWARPTLDVNGLLGGFTGEGAKTVLPARAMAKVSMRLVPYQKHHDIAQKVMDYIRQITPPGVTVHVQDLHGADPVLVPRDSPAMHAAVAALEETFGTRCRFTREGGSIPVVLLFDTILKAPTVLMGFGLNNENAHSPDEHFDLGNFHIGMRAAARYYELMAATPAK
ncbi:MAG: dipeptidase [Ignavibacteria bacterium]|nr:dipeptidase [Ignavibacteria bacterium]MBP6510682.1 dipeptidase [Candidatus Kapabacteria bacterium]MBK6418373.1 dipeptidase [Ignavibacteria bacterium]MBK6761087.1 dipeptidase [Ignavibacteria bacterium]MBK7032110.1 dipeptidase [Ignavibacteria bacterium]